MGIHGEPGAFTCETKDADELASTMIKAILDKPGYLKIPSGGDVGVLVNNLGATSPMEMSVVARGAIKCLEGRGLKPTRERKFQLGPRSRTHLFFQTSQIPYSPICPVSLECTQLVKLAFFGRVRILSWT